MTTIYWITGAIGAGKTTLGAALAGALPETLFIDGDFLLPDITELPFSERIIKRKDALIEKSKELAQQQKNAVIAYPLLQDTAAHLRQALDEYGVKLIVIGIKTPPPAMGTRGYNEQELKRQSEMVEFGGKDYADIVLVHPTGYLHDSLAALLQKLGQ